MSFMIVKELFEPNKPVKVVSFMEQVNPINQVFFACLKAVKTLVYFS